MTSQSLKASGKCDNQKISIQFIVGIATQSTHDTDGQNMHQTLGKKP